jgi:hypothetical protein
MYGYHYEWYCYVAQDAYEWIGPGAAALDDVRRDFDVSLSSRQFD